MLRLRLLGDLALERDGVLQRRFRARKYGVLLAFLALNTRRAHAREELAELFWPDAESEAGRTCLRTALTSLRRQLQDSDPRTEGEATPDLFLERDRTTLQINSRVVTTDAAEFEQLALRGLSATDNVTRRTLLDDALELYRGPLLPGVYDDWVITERERLEAVREQVDEAIRVLPSPPPFSLPATIFTLPRGARAKRGKIGEGPVILRLPLSVTPFYGRVSESERLHSWLAPTTEGNPVRLITLTGTAGMGKTRLATEAAHRAATEGVFPGVVCFVGLSACQEAERLPELIAEALLLERAPGADPLEVVAALLRQAGRSLLALDNLEQLVESGVAPVVRRLLAAAPDLVVLATSRQPLLIEGEREFALTGLPESDSTRLFAERAQMARPDFVITPRNTETIHEICEGLDGIPLAIELCAAWANLLTPTQMRERLTRRFELLTSRRRDVNARHRSLHAALESSVPTDSENRLFFAQMSVFRGGWSLEAAEAVTGKDALAPLADLRERSLVVVEGDGESVMRYRFLETVRDFAEELLTETERNLAIRRHFAYFWRFATYAASEVHHRDEVQAFNLLEDEDANIRAALEWGLKQGSPEEVGDALQLVRRLVWHWWVRGRDYETALRSWLERAVERLPTFSGLLRASVLRSAAYLARGQGDRLTATQHYEESADLYRAAGDRDGERAVALSRASLADECGDQVERQVWLNAALSLSDSEESRNEVRNEMRAAYDTVGERAKAREIAEYLLEYQRRHGPPGHVAKLSLTLASYDREAGYPEKAEARAREALAYYSSSGELWNLSDSLFQIGIALRAQGKQTEARAILIESQLLFARLADTAKAQEIDSWLQESEDTAIPRNASISSSDH